MRSKNSRFERVKRLIDKKITGYNVAYYSARSIGESPRITFAVLDDEEVFLARPDHKLAIRHPDLAAFFSKYYEDIWDRGTKLKNVNQVNGEELKRLEALLP